MTRAIFRVRRNTIADNKNNEMLFDRIPCTKKYENSSFEKVNRKSLKTFNERINRG
jgi:hypothetical protein